MGKNSCIKIKVRVLLTIVFLIGVLVSMAQQQEKSMISYTNYLLYMPKDSSSNELFPLLLFLHGSGERGNDLNLLKRNGLPSFLDNKTDFPFIVISPQCPDNRNWDVQNLLTLLDHVEATLPVDKNRIYVTGLSMGGFGTWKLAQAAPERFAAIAPICGGGDIERLCIMRNMPVWAFHGLNDSAVPYTESERLIQRLKEWGSDVKFTLYPDLGHDSWTPAYQNQELYNWFLSKSKKKHPVNVDVKVLKSYIGNYKYSDKAIIEVSYLDSSLYVKSSLTDKKLLLTPITETKFRIPGPINGGGEMYFNLQQGKVDGFTVGPCDHTYCPKIN